MPKKQLHAERPTEWTSQRRGKGCFWAWYLFLGAAFVSGRGICFWARLPLDAYKNHAEIEKARPESPLADAGQSGSAAFEMARRPITRALGHAGLGAGTNPSEATSGGMVEGS